MFVVRQCVDTANTCVGAVCIDTAFVLLRGVGVRRASTHCFYFAHVDSRSVSGVPDGYFGALVQLGYC